MDQRGEKGGKTEAASPLDGPCTGNDGAMTGALRAWDRGSGERPANTQSVPERRQWNIT